MTAHARHFARLCRVRLAAAEEKAKQADEQKQDEAKLPSRVVDESDGVVRADSD